jgi:TolB protein
MLRWALLILSAPVFAAGLGPFSQVSDVGIVSRPVAASYDAKLGTLTMSAGGENIWGTRDAFGFAWKKMSGDLALGARVEFRGAGAQPHRKAGLMLRQSLAPDSAYADLVVHGNGLTSLQWRDTTGGPTHEIQCAQRAPAALKLEKRGSVVIVSLANPEGIFDKVGCSVRIAALKGAVYAGLALCAHDTAAYETADFKHVTVGIPGARPDTRIASIEILDLESLSRRTIYHSATALEAVSFTKTGAAICYRDDRQLQRFGLDGTQEPVAIGIESAADCETLYAPGVTPAQLPGQSKGRASMPRRSPDGLTIVYLQGAVRDDAADYVLLSVPAAGGEPRELAQFHGGKEALGSSPWSADGKSIVFVSREAD